MALLPWNEEDKDKEDSLFNPAPVKAVRSVQNGAWQPTQATATGGIDQPNQSYLLSEEKAQSDAKKAQREEAEANARAESARQVAAARAAEAQTATEERQAGSRYAPTEGNKDEGLWGIVKGIGAGLQQGLGAIGDVAIQGGGILNAISNPFASKEQNDANLRKNLDTTERVRGWLHGNKDINGDELVGTSDVEKQATDIAMGRGDLQDYMAVGGKSLQIGLDSTMLLNPSRIAAKGIPGAAGLASATRALNPAMKVFKSPAVRYAARDAAFFGSLQGTATFQSVYGQTGDFEQAIEAALKDAAIGAALQGTLDLSGVGVNAAGNKLAGALRGRNELTPVKDTIEPIDGTLGLPQDTSLTPASDTPAPADGNVSFRPAESTGVSQPSDLLENAANDVAPVADGIATPENLVSPAIQDTPVVPELPVTDTPQAQVADGVPIPSKAIPATDPNVPPIKSEEVRRLQESKVGKSQAEEATVNQKLQEIDEQSPKKRSMRQFEYEEVPLTVGERRALAEIDSNRTATDYQEASSELRQLATEAGQPELYQRVMKAISENNMPQVDALEFIKRGLAGMRDSGVNARIRSAPKSDETKWLEASREQKTTRPNMDESPVAQANRELKDKNIPTVSYGKIPGASPELIKRTQEIIDERSPGKPTPVEKPLSVPERATPVKSDSLPDGMEAPKEKVTPIKSDEQVFAKRFMTSTDSSKAARQQLATSVGLEKDAASDLPTILSDAGVDAKSAARITDIHNKMEEIAKRDKAIQKANQKDFVAGREVNQEQTKVNSRDVRELGVLQRKFQSEIDRLKRQGVKNLPEKATQMLQNIASGRLANMLTGAGLIERNIVQELGANLISTIKNPIKTTRGAFNHGSNVKSAAKASYDGWRDTPKTVSEGYQYLTGNIYKTSMTGADAASRARAGGFRTEATKWAYKEIMDKDISSAEAEKLSRTAGNVTEGVVHMLRGVDNGMVSNTQAMRALKAWKQYMRTGSAADLRKLDDLITKQSTLADAMVRGFNFKDGSKAGRLLTTMVNSVFPFMRTAYNLTNTGVTRTLNPFSKSLLDEIRADQRSGGKNAALILKNKLVDYGLIGGAVALVQSDVIAYNDGDEVDKPRGISIKIGDNEYVSIRATPIELPLAVAATVGQIVKDTTAGKVREPKYYAGMLSGSLPYIDQLESNTGLIDSVLNWGGKDDDGGYALKQYGVNLAKSHVPGSNNGLQAYLERWNGNSLDAKKVYDEDPMQWLYNSVVSAYNPEFRDSLEESRDNAGRVRTVDNQGTFIRKDMNDASTAEFNDDIDDLVSYAREIGTGSGTAEMFNTYDTGKNNNFKSTQDAITFLDAVDGKPDNTKKLEKNEKLADLSSQIRNGFFGDSGDELLTLDGQNLKSDASVPIKSGAKNSKLPINMQSIKNAIAATDLPEEQRDRMYEIAQANDALYARRKNKEITYDQEQALKAENEQEYVDILSGSENYKKMQDLFDELDGAGFFEADGLGSTRSGQTYLWNSLNALLGAKGATPAANYPDPDKTFTPAGSRATIKNGNTGTDGIKWKQGGVRQMAAVKQGKYTPVNIKVKLGNAVKKDKSQNYSDKTF